MALFDAGVLQQPRDAIRALESLQNPATHSHFAADKWGIMRTNRTVNEDVAEILYRERSLCVLIQPDKLSWTVKNIKVDPCHLAHADFSKFSKIRIEIFGPRRKDPAQLLVLGNHVLDLVATLQGFRPGFGLEAQHYDAFHHLLKLNQELSSSALPNIELVFVNHGSFSWFNKDTPRRSLKKLHQFDIEHILDLFRHLKNARGATVTLPSQAKGNSFLEKCATNAEASMQLRAGGKQAVRDSDTTLFAAHSRLAISLDHALDAMSGLTAANLRLERFMNWRNYKRHLGLIVAEFDENSTEYRKTEHELYFRTKNWSYLKSYMTNSSCRPAADDFDCEDDDDDKGSHDSQDSDSFDGERSDDDSDASFGIEEYNLRDYETELKLNSLRARRQFILGTDFIQRDCRATITRRHFALLKNIGEEIARLQSIVAGKGHSSNFSTTEQDAYTAEIDRKFNALSSHKDWWMDPSFLLENDSIAIARRQFAEMDEVSNGKVAIDLNGLDIVTVVEDGCDDDRPEGEITRAKWLAFFPYGIRAGVHLHLLSIGHWY